MATPTPSSGRLPSPREGFLRPSGRARSISANVKSRLNGHFVPTSAKEYFQVLVYLLILCDQYVRSLAVQKKRFSSCHMSDACVKHFIELNC